MSGAKPAALSRALLFTKGRASPDGFLPLYATPPRIGRAPAVAFPPSAPRLTVAGGTPPGDDVRLSLRLDPARHVRLKLAMAHLRQSGQALIVAALDHYLDQVVPSLLGERCACLDQPSASDRPGGGHAPCCGASRSLTPRS